MRGLRSRRAPITRLWTALVRCGPHSCGGPVVLPAALPGREHEIRILRSSEAAVIAAERAEVVALFHVQIVPQDGAAVREIGAHVEEIVLRLADQLQPE